MRSQMFGIIRHTQGDGYNGGWSSTRGGVIGRMRMATRVSGIYSMRGGSNGGNISMGNGFMSVGASEQTGVAMISSNHNNTEKGLNTKWEQLVLNKEELVSENDIEREEEDMEEVSIPMPMLSFQTEEARRCLELEGELEKCKMVCHRLISEKSDMWNNLENNERIYESQINDLEECRDKMQITNDTLEQRLVELEGERVKMRESYERLLEEKCEEKCELEGRLEVMGRDLKYYQTRMEQEKMLSRQLVLQVEELQKNQRAPVPTLESTSLELVEMDLGDGGEREESESTEGLKKEEGVTNTSGVSSDGTTDGGSGVRLAPLPCVVCLTTYAHHEYQSIPCEHPICVECYIRWFASRMYYNDTRLEGEPPVEFSCPICRTPIDANQI